MKEVSNKIHFPDLEKEILHLLAVPEIKTDTLMVEPEGSIPEKSPDPSSKPTIK